MAVLNAVDRLTAIELVKRSGVDKNTKLIIEALAQTNELMLDMPMVEANDGTVHTNLVRTSNPSGTHRTYNQGVVPSASTTEAVKDIITMLADYSVVDRKLAEHSGNKAQFISDECIAFINGMGISQAQDIIYGDNGLNKAEINGFATRRKALSTVNCFSLAGTGDDLTSVYLVAAGRGLTHLIYPKGSKNCGVNREDQGVQNWDDGSGTGAKFPAYVNFFEAEYGISVGHPKSLIRICNIEKDINADTLVDKILELSYHLPKIGVANYVLYGNMNIMQKIDKATRSKVNVAYTKEDPWGNPISWIRNIRCRQVDQILDTESAIS